MIRLTLAATALLLGSSDTLAQNAPVRSRAAVRPSFHPGESAWAGSPLNIHGLPHTLLGGASASYAAPTWTIANVGGAPEAGVSIGLQGAMGLAIAHPGLALHDGEWIETRLQGVVGGQPATIATLREEFVSDRVVFSADFSGTGATAYTVQLRDGDRIVYEGQASTGFLTAIQPYTCPDGSLAEWVCHTETRLACEAGKTDWVSAEFCDLVCLTVDGTPYTADKMVFFRDPETGEEVDGVTLVEFVSNTPGVPISGEALQFHDIFVSTYEDGSGPTDTTLDLTGGDAAATGLGGPGSGLEFTFDQATADSFTLDAPLVEGASRTLTAFGTVDGVAGHPLFEQQVAMVSGEMIVSADFSPLGSTSFDMVVSHLGVPVHTASGVANGEAFKVAAGGEVTYKTEYVWNPPRTTCCLPEVIVYGSAFSVLADQVTLSANSPTGFVSGGVSQRIVVDGIRSLTIGTADVTPLPTLDWGRGLAGTGGVTPKLVVSGPLVGGTVAGFGLFDALPNGIAFVVLGLVEISVPFKGGVLVPSPDLVLAVPTGPTGTLVFPVPWPNDPLLEGYSLYMQDAILDVGAPAGIAMSNAVQMTTP